ncbi:rCG39355, isoform CRA_b [Rattus norvegicus]|uniref:RCG39355, isoform CRA_b n=1 Tax=Rattus norvegicus TaxID=10116 RepID=A6I6L8_RAT|nr:rCG39355, isoform CRA_b [Rattus norvegicus]
MLPVSKKPRTYLLLTVESTFVLLNAGKECILPARLGSRVGVTTF